MLKNLFFLSALSLTAITGCATGSVYHSQVGVFAKSAEGFTLPAERWSYADQSIQKSERPGVPAHEASMRVFVQRETHERVVALSIPNQLSTPEELADVEAGRLRAKGVNVSRVEVSRSHQAARYKEPDPDNADKTMVTVLVRTPGKNRGIIRLIATAPNGYDPSDIFDFSK